MSLSLDNQLSNLKGKKALIFASTGGHLHEALLLASKLELSNESIYVTHPSRQTSSILKGKKFIEVAHIGTRDLRSSFWGAKEILSKTYRIDYDLIISTGAAIAISALPLHIFRKKSFFFFDSLTRLDNPSLTGKILEWFPSVLKYSSNFGDKRRGWRRGPSILNNLSLSPKFREKQKNLKILVTLGTHPRYRFDRLLDIVLPLINPGDQVTWQLGATNNRILPGKIFDFLSNEELLTLIHKSDCVITHCGIGTVLDLISLRIKPIAIPRNSKINEHVDDHQIDAFDLLSGSKILINRNRSQITRLDLIEATKYRFKR